MVIERPWLMDDFDAWSQHLSHASPHRCAVIFCDNSGADCILGILPFARHLLSMGTRVSVYRKVVKCLLFIVNRILMFI